MTSVYLLGAAVVIGIVGIGLLVWEARKRGEAEGEAEPLKERNRELEQKARDAARNPGRAKRLRWLRRIAGME